MDHSLYTNNLENSLCCCQYVFSSGKTLKNTLLIVLYGGIMEWWSKRLTVFQVSELSSLIIICTVVVTIKKAKQDKNRWGYCKFFSAMLLIAKYWNLLPWKNTPVHCYLKPHEYRYSQTCIKWSPKGNERVNESDPRSNVHYLSSSDLFGTNIRLASSVGRALHRYRRGHEFKSRTGLNFFQALFSLLPK